MLERLVHPSSEEIRKMIELFALLIWAYFAQEFVLLQDFVASPKRPDCATDLLRFVPMRTGGRLLWDPAIGERSNSSARRSEPP